MSLIVEDGTGVAGAESYVTLVVADAYFDARTHLALFTTWDAATDAKKEGALREASAYLDAKYGAYYKGLTAGAVQGLLWPRTGAADSAGFALQPVPSELQRASCELAARALSEPLASDDARGGKVKRLKAGSVEIEYADGAPVVTVYGIVDGIMEPLLNGKQGAAQWNWA
jgi:hypothetical protein